MSQRFLHLKYLIGEGPGLLNMSGLIDTLAGLNLGNIENHQAVADFHPNLVLKFEYLKDLHNVDPLNISG